MGPNQKGIPLCGPFLTSIVTSTEWLDRGEAKEHVMLNVSRHWYIYLSHLAIVFGQERMITADS